MLNLEINLFAKRSFNVRRMSDTATLVLFER